MTSQFNFSKKPFENQRLSQLIIILTASLLIPLTLIHGYFLLTHYLAREHQGIEFKIEKVKKQIEETEQQISQNRKTLEGSQPDLVKERLLFLKRIYRHKKFSWTDLFHELEKIIPANVKIVSIQPIDIDGHMTVNLALIGKKLANIIEMVTALEASSSFNMVFPLNEVELSELSTGETGIAATLGLQYVDTAYSESKERTQ